jgi:hypothetical protein
MLYLNNSGSRWITADMRFVLVMPDGMRKVRTARCYESFGNFAVTIYRIGSKQFAGLAKDCNGYETHAEGVTGDDALPHIFHEKSRVY